MIPEFVRYIAAAVVVIGLLIWYTPRKNGDSLLSYPNTQAYCVPGKL